MTLQFALEKSIDAAATDVQTAISQAAGSLPIDLPTPPTFSKTNPNDQPIMYVALTSDSLTSGQLYDYASTQVGQRISILPGVSRVNVFGTKSAVRIKADPSAMWARGITVDALAAAIQGGTHYTGAGQLDAPTGTSLLRPHGQLDTAQAYEELIVGEQDGSPVPPEGRREGRRLGAGRAHPDALLGAWVRGPRGHRRHRVNRQAGANAGRGREGDQGLGPGHRDGAPGVRAHHADLRPLAVDRQLRRRRAGDARIAFVLVVLVIFLFLGRATDTLIPAVALPLSLLLTFIAMRRSGTASTTLSLMALTLAIGFLVDDAIVFLENAVRRMDAARSPSRRRSTARARSASRSSR
jgi:HAE1 family hydrophobic/amphiphilic exporter-1